MTKSREGEVPRCRVVLQTLPHTPSGGRGVHTMGRLPCWTVELLLSCALQLRVAGPDRDLARPLCAGVVAHLT